MNAGGCICIFMSLVSCFFGMCVCPGPLCGDSWCGSDPGWKEALCFFVSPFPSIHGGHLGPLRFLSASGSENEGGTFWDWIRNSRSIGKNAPHTYTKPLNSPDCKDLVQFRKSKKPKLFSISSSSLSLNPLIHLGFLLSIFYSPLSAFS